MFVHKDAVYFKKILHPTNPMNDQIIYVILILINSIINAKVWMHAWMIGLMDKWMFLHVEIAERIWIRFGTEIDRTLS